MGFIREPLDVDFYIIDKPWSDEELAEFRKIMNVQKSKYAQKENRRMARKKGILEKIDAV